VKERAFAEWKQFLKLGDGALENEELHHELEALATWNWGDGIDQRHAIIGAALMLSEINKKYEMYISLGDRPVINALLFSENTSGFLHNLDLQTAIERALDNDADDPESVESLHRMLTQLLARVERLRPKQMPAPDRAGTG
jgi:hypothetical protein